MSYGTPHEQRTSVGMAGIHILRPGSFVDQNGQAVTFSAADLAATAKAYDPALHEAPLVVGHPKHDDPAWGWVASLSASDDGLEAQPVQVDASFAELHRAGRWKKISASLYRPGSPANPVPGVWYLRHVGFLGAQPPAVKGLRQVSLGETETDFLTLELAELPAAQPDSHPIQETTTVSDEELQALKAKNQALAAELAEANAKAEALIEAAKKTEAERRQAGHAAFAEKLRDAHKLPEGDMPLVCAVLELAEAAETQVELGEGDNKKPLTQALRDFFAGMKPLVELSEVATKDRAAEQEADSVTYAEGLDPERIELDKKIRAYAKAHNLTYTQAAKTIAAKEHSA